MRKEHRELFWKHCKHTADYNKRAYSSDWEWKNCSDCLLWKMPFDVPHSGSVSGTIQRDVCFAIWHGR